MPTAELTRKDALLANLRGISARIEAACRRSGRDPSAVNLLAVTKYADPADVRLLVESGAITRAGESRVQDAVARWGGGGTLADLRSRVELHFIGRLQTNKARAAAELFDWIDSVDSVRLAAELDRHAAAAGRRLSVLIQLRLSAAPGRSGVTPGEAAELLEAVRRMPSLRARGYMGIAPVEAGPEELSSLFPEIKRLFDRDFPGPGNYLSLGMSGDLEPAVEAGSTLPRLGASVFA